MNRGKKTKKQLVVDHLTRYKSIDHSTAFNQFHITRLDKVISQIRKEGIHQIETERLKYRTRYKLVS